MPLLPVLREALGVLSPVGCAGCGLADVELCPACRGLLAPRLDELWLAGGHRVVSALRYEFEVRAVLLSFKQRGRVRLASALAPALAAAVDRVAPPRPGLAPAVVVAVPPSPTGRRRRGWDPVGALVRRARLPVLAGALAVRPGRGGAQKSRDRDGRRRGREGSLRVRRPVAGLRVVVVDDVVTTGSTLEEARRALTSAGAEVVGSACLAATPLLARRSM